MFEQLVGQSLDRYQILRLLGEGTTGAIFQARDVALQRDVALRVMSPDFTRQPEQQERFLQQARTAAALDHPGIVKVLDFGRAHRQLYLVMEFLAGQNLRQVLNLLSQTRQHLLPWPEALHLTRQICLAMDYAHQHGVVYGDFRPTDIMFKSEPSEGFPYRPVVTHLGLARMHNAGRLDPTVMTLVQLAYLAPEQVLGAPPDARSEVYALGVLLYELVSGRWPFLANTVAEALYAITQEAPPAPRSLRPDLPEMVESIILGALAKDAAHRFAGARALAEALYTALPNAPEGTLSHIAPYVLAANGIPSSSNSPTTPATALPHPNRFESTSELIHVSPGEGRVGVLLDTTQLSVAPGKSVTLLFTILNQGPTANHIQVSVTGMPSTWLVASPLTFQLLSGTQKEVTLAIQPPRAPQTRAGRYPLLIRVASQESPDQVVQVKVTLTVTAYSQFTSQIDPPQLRTAEPAQVRLQNQGNVPETFTVSWHNLAGELDFVPPETQITVPEGEMADVTFFATPRHQHWLGGARAYPFTALVSSTAGETQTHTSELVSRALIPVWVLPFALFICLLLSAASAMAYEGYTAQVVSATQTAQANQLALVRAMDSDNDGLVNAEEVDFGTDPLNPDSDGDGLLDGEEKRWGTDPQVTDSDADTLVDGQEVHDLNTSPVNPDTDGDGLNDNVDPDPGSLPTPTLVPPTLTLTPLPPTLTFTPLPPTATFTPLPSTSTATPAPPTLTHTPPPPTARAVIVFESQRDGNSEIYAMSADGANQTRLTNNAAADTSPVWSPDGARVAFESKRDGNSEIYVMNADGGNPTRLTNNTADDIRPIWSPDGTRLAFESKRDGNSEIYVMSADGSNQIRLTNNAVTDCCLAWSPDGARLAFASEGEGLPGLYVINVDGSGLTRLAEAILAEATWSSDGGRIAFASDQDGDIEIYVVNADGSQLTRLTNQPGLDSRPHWSPDGAQIAFVSERDGNSEIYRMNADGSGQTRLTNNSLTDCCLSWSPDGQRLVLATDRDGNFEIYVMKADGSGQTRLTNHPAYDAFPVWQARP